MELSHLKTVLLDQDLKEENSPAEIRAKINSDNRKLEETVQMVKNTGNKHTVSRKMIHSADIENSWYEGPTKTYQNPLSVSRKPKLNENWKKNRGILAENNENSQMHKSSKPSTLE